MDYVIRCPACGHSVSLHSTDGCYGENLQCACTDDREYVLRAVRGAAVTLAAAVRDPEGAEAG